MGCGISAGAGMKILREHRRVRCVWMTDRLVWLKSDGIGGKG